MSLLYTVRLQLLGTRATNSETAHGESFLNLVCDQLESG
jgi:hypothetical protein